MSRKVTFWISTGYVGSDKRETFALEELGIDENEFETEDELEKAIDEAYQEWLWSNVDNGWGFEDE